MKPIEQLQGLIKELSLEGIIIGRRDNFKWLTGGIENAVVSNTETGVVYFVIFADGKRMMLADSSDGPRATAEFGITDAATVIVPWYETMEKYLQEICQTKKMGLDFWAPEAQNVSERLLELRMQLSEKEIRKYRILGKDCAEIVEDIVRGAKPGQTEKEVAWKVKSCCVEKGISPDCVLVGSDERILNYRHPMPTNREIKSSLMVVLGGERDGLNISLTRMAYFGDVPEEIRRRMYQTQQIFANMQMEMAAHVSYSDYFRIITKAYQDVGCPGEWKMHHQGGPTGYGCREFVVRPDTKGEIRCGQAYAWNPTVQGTKCEDTTILTGNHQVEILSQTKTWPRVSVATKWGRFEVADILCI